MSEKIIGWKCKGKDCGKIFYIPARISTKTPEVPYGAKGQVIEKSCCPHCESIDFEPAKELKK